MMNLVSFFFFALTTLAKKADAGLAEAQALRTHLWNEACDDDSFHLHLEDFFQNFTAAQPEHGWRVLYMNGNNADCVVTQETESDQSGRKIKVTDKPITGHTIVPITARSGRKISTHAKVWGGHLQSHHHEEHHHHDRSRRSAKKGAHYEKVPRGRYVKDRFQKGNGKTEKFARRHEKNRHAAENRNLNAYKRIMLGRTAGQAKINTNSSSCTRVIFGGVYPAINVTTYTNDQMTQSCGLSSNSSNTFDCNDNMDFKFIYADTEYNIYILAFCGPSETTGWISLSSGVLTDGQQEEILMFVENTLDYPSCMHVKLTNVCP